MISSDQETEQEPNMYVCACLLSVSLLVVSSEYGCVCAASQRLLCVWPAPGNYQGEVGSVCEMRGWKIEMAWVQWHGIAPKNGEEAL